MHCIAPSDKPSPRSQDDYPDDTPACDLPATTPAELEVYEARAAHYWSPAESRRRRFIRARQILAEFGEAEPSFEDSELGHLIPQPAPAPDTEDGEPPERKPL